MPTWLVGRWAATSQGRAQCSPQGRAQCTKGPGARTPVDAEDLGTPRCFLLRGLRCTARKSPGPPGQTNFEDDAQLSLGEVACSAGEILSS